MDKLQLGSKYVSSISVFFITVKWSKTVIGLTNRYLHVKNIKSSALNHNRKLIFLTHINMANIFFNIVANTTNITLKQALIVLWLQNNFKVDGLARRWHPKNMLSI